MFLFSALNTSEGITYDDKTITFFFGPRVLVPYHRDENITITEVDLCFEIGLDCTVLDIPSLVQGQSLPFAAVVETDFGVRTSTVRISPQVNLVS